MAGAISLGLVGANPTATVLANLTTGSATVKASINATLNSALKTYLADSIDKGGYPAIAGLLKEMPAADIAANENTTLQAFMSAQLDPLVAKDPAMRQAVDAELSNISTTTTVGTLLGLSQPLQSHALFTIGVNQAQLGTLLSTNPLLTSTQLQTDFITAYAASAGSITDFWSQLSQNPEFTAIVPQFQLTLQMGAFTLNNPAMVSALHTAINPSKFRDLTQLNVTTVTSLITSNNIQIPSVIPGQTAANYAAAMMSLLTAAFPTDFVTQGLKTSTDVLNQGVATFLENSPDFDLATTNVNSYIKQNSGTAFKGISADQVTPVSNRLLAVQRVFRVHSDPNVIETLVGNGLDSARKIASMPQGVFMRQYTPALGQATALLVYNGAQQIAGMASNVYRTIQEALQQSYPAAIGNTTPTLTDTLNQVIPNWQTLFGSTSYCECDECTAMDGPAAYFVDLLQFLQGSNTGGTVNPLNPSGFSPLDVLIGYQNNPNNNGNPVSAGAPLGRRPDLAYLKLTCANSDTPLPYVDLINEILESYVYYVGISSTVAASLDHLTLKLASPSAPNFPTAGFITQVNGIEQVPPIQYALGSDNETLIHAVPSASSGSILANPGLNMPVTLAVTCATLPAASNNTPSDATADELSVNPEYTIPTVYSGPLVTSIYPFNIPYDRYLDTARIYLNFLGSSRYSLMRSFGIYPAPQDQQAMMAAESLNLNETEYELITGTSFQLNTPAPSQYTYSSANAYTFYGYPAASVTQPDSTGTLQTLPWNQWLIQVPEFLKRTGVSFTDLVSLLETEYLNPGQTIFLQFADNTCDLDTAQIAGAITTTVTISGKPTVWNTINLLITSTALAGSPIEFSYTIGGPPPIGPLTPGRPADVVSGPVIGDTVLAAAALALQINANATLNAAGIYASASDGTITISTPSSLNPSPLWTSNITTINPGAAATVNVTVASSSSVPNFLADLPPFLRLWKKLGWQIPELDKAITALNTGGINRSFVLAVAQLQQLRMTLNVSVNQLLSLWALIDADGRDSLYISLFQNKAVINPLDPDFALTYRAAVLLPQNFPVLPATWPDGTANAAVYDSTNNLLKFPGTMSDAERDNLLTWAGNNDSAILAVQNLFDQRWTPGTDIVVPAGQSPLMAAHLNTILAALQVGAADLSTIAADCGLVPASGDLGATAWAQLGGSVTPHDVVALSMGYTSHGVVHRAINISCTVVQGDTLPSIAARLVTTINGNVTMQQRGVSASIQGALINLYYSLNPMTKISWENNTAATATETVTLSINPALSLAALSSLYRYAVLAQALNLSVSDLITLRTLTGLNPFTLAASDPVTSSTSLFVQAAQAVASSKFSVAQLNYLYRALPDAADSLPPLQATEDQLAISLSVGLQKIAAANTYAPDPSGNALQKKLAILLPADQSALTMSLINGSAAYTCPLANFPAGIALLSVTTATIGGSITSGDKVTLTLTSTAVAGSPVSVTYPVAGTDSPTLIAAQLASLVSGNAMLSAAGITASVSGSVVNLFVPSSLNPTPIWTANISASSPSGSPTETVSLSNTLTLSFVNTVTIGGNIKVGDTIGLTATSASLAGSPVNLPLYIVAPGDTATSIAANLAATINSNSSLSAAGISASASNGTITIAAPSSLNPYPVWSPLPSGTGGAAPTETVTLSTLLAFNGLMTTAMLTQQQQVNGASGNQAFLKAVSSLYSQGQLILSENLSFLAPDQVYSTLLSESPLSVTLPPVPPGQVIFATSATVATVGGLITNGDQITLTMTPPATAGSPVNVVYNVVGSDTLVSIAAKLAALINSTPALSAAGVSAAASGTVISLNTGTLNPGWSCPPSSATEKITFSGTLSCDGPMTTSTLVQLLGLTGASTAFLAAAQNLYNQAWNAPAEALSGAPAAAGYDFVLSNLLSYLKSTQSQSLVKQTLCQALSMDAKLIALLLEGDPTTGAAALLPSNAIQTSPAQPAMVDFLGGLLANYYTGTNLTNPLQTRIDPGIDLDGTEPAFGSGQWLGRIVPPTTDTYTFTLVVPAAAPTGGQVQLWIDDQLVIDTTQNPPVQVSINLAAGEIYDFQMNFIGAPAAAPFQFRLQWATTSASQTTIPATVFVLGANPNFAQAVQNSTSFVLGGVHSTLSLLNRIAVLVDGFSMQTNDVAYLSARKTDFQGVDPGNSSNTVPFELSTLPFDYFPNAISPSGSDPNQAGIDQTAVAFFNQWQRLNNLYTLMSTLPSGNTTLFAVFAAASQSGNSNPPVSLAVATAVLQATNWSAADFNSLVGPSGFNLADVNFINETWLVQIAACLGWAKRLGISALQLLNWANTDPDAAQAQDIVNTVKAKYSDTAWAAVGKPLNDKIRAHSKNALIAYILNMAPIVDLGLMDADDLYDYFLIDVSMTTCMITSRIVQATAAVQQFVQRCLLNLENGNSNANLNISPSAIDATQWENWRKNYRVWQAAVQVFLYPENWIDPTLRDNRTELFMDLQTQLLQGSVTSDNAEAAFGAYLEGLRQIARLEMMGIYNQVDPTPGINYTHVFGRTYTTPHVYYYRYYDNNLNVWSNWEKMDLEITGDQLIPVIWNNRLNIFWPNYKEVSDPTDTSSASTSLSPTSNGGFSTGAPSPAKKSLQVTMSWSEYQQGTWTRKQTTPDSNPMIPVVWDSNQGQFVEAYTGALDTTQFSFQALLNGGALSIWMYQTIPSQQTGIAYDQETIGYFTLNGATINASQTGSNFGATSAPFFRWAANWAPINMGVEDQSANDGLSLIEFDHPNFDSMSVLTNPINGFDLMFPQYLGGYYDLTFDSPIFFFQDSLRTFYVTEETSFIIIEFTNGSYAKPHYQPSHLTVSTTEFQISAPIIKSQEVVAVSAAASTQTTQTNSITGTAPTVTFNPNQYLPVDQWRYYLNNVNSPWPYIVFTNHYHPWVDEFIRLFNWQGIPLLMDITTQQLGAQVDPNDPSNTSPLFNFQNTYGPTSIVSTNYPSEIVDTTPSGAYSIYNWELFLHIPLLVGTLLSQNQQFQDAKTWFEYVFDPTNDSSEPIPNRYWNFNYFNQNTLDGQIGDLLNTLLNPSSPGYAQAYSQVQQWWNSPFDPDAVARLRPVAYEKALVMAYINNLIAWGDNLFSQNTRESINEATQLYVLADKILGPKPVMVPSQGTVIPVAYKDLQWNSLDNALVQLENVFPFSISSNPSNSSDSGSSVVTSQGGLSTGSVPYFCTPVNSQLLTYWDTVADRLYKIRHCMNIQGQVQQLPLFAPPINPALLVQAAAAGVDLSSVLSDINAAVPYYRFTYMFSKALELCAEVRSLGASLLSALEKKDAEALALLRASQEVSVLQAVLQIKQSQIDEAQDNLQALQDSLAVTQAKQNYYETLVSAGPLNSLETAQTNNLTQSQTFKQRSQLAGLLGSELSLIPQLDFGVTGAGGTPKVTAAFGGQQLSTMASMVAQAFSFQAEYYSFVASMAGLMAGWGRRFAEWQFQLQTAGLEITQINDQVNAANIRVQIAQQDFASQNLQISNAQAVQDFLTNKFTNEDLYSWMIDQVSGVYFQCYQMAYDLAKRAEACFQFELGLSDSNFIQFGYWDSLKQGLLSGEKLYLDLKRLEGAYLDQNKREYEISKSISLQLLDPLALIALKETGQCLVSLPEAYFDMDYPGHYMRRIKCMSLTIPCVTGPYTSVNCTLTLQQSKIRANTQSSQQGDPYLESPIGSDPRFFYNYAATQSIATSTGQNDSGMFEVNFRDERYLPFEGGGVISQWLISMPPDCNAFDFDTITDLILNLKYTARNGGAPFAALARAAATFPGPQLQAGISSPSIAFPKQSNLNRLFSLKHEFPTEWYQFMHPASAATSEVMSIPLTNDRFPFQYRGKKITVSQVQIFLQFKAVYPTVINSASTPLADYGSSSLPFWLAPPSVALNASNGSLATSSGVLSVPCASVTFATAAAIYAVASGKLVPWTLTINSSDIQTALSAAPNLTFTPAGGGGPFLNPEVIDDIFFVCQYAVR